jgi:hypothetical protein
MWMRIVFLRIGICLSFLAGGCATPKEIKPLTDGQLRGIFSQAKDARNFWVTVYKADKGVQFAGANRLHPEHVANRNFIKESPSAAPLIQADNGRDEMIVALIDTSSARSWLDLAAFTRVKAIPLGPPAYNCTPNQVNDAIPGYACILTKLRFDQLHMENAVFHFRAATGPLGSLARGEDHPAPSAILGCDILNAFAFVQIDYPNHSVMFSATTEYSPDGTNLIATLPLREVDGAFAVDGMVDSEKKLILLDSAGEFETTMENPPSDKLKQVSVGDLVFRNVTVASSQDGNLGLLSHPRIGRRLLSRFVVTFAPKKKLVYFERPDQIARKRNSGDRMQESE